MTFEAILSDLKAKKYAPVYLLHGEEAYFIDKVSSYLEHHVLTESEKAFNQLVFYGKEVSAMQIIDNARQFPMMSQWRVVVIKEAQAMSKIEDLTAYVNSPSPQTILVIDHKYKKLDGRSKLIKAIKAKGVIFESKKLYDNQIAPWIARAVAAKGKKIEPKATEMMAEYLGSDLSKVANEIDKILVNLKDQNTITQEIVQQQVGITKDYNVFELQKYLGTRDTEKVFRIIKYFGDNPKSNPLIVVLGSLFNYFAKVYTTVYYLKKAPDKELAQLVGVSPFFLGEYKTAARNYSIGKLVGVFSALKSADLKSKGVGSRNTTENEILRELMIKILY